MKFQKELKALLKLCLICFTVLPSSLLGQEQEDIYQKVAQETCACISKNNLDGQTKEQIEMALGICMLESISNNKIDVEISNPEAMKEFGRKVGVKMAPICPNVFKAFLKEGGGNSHESEKASNTLTGKIKSIDIDGFLFLTLKDDSGNEQRLIWLSNFAGSDSFIAEPKKLVGKNVAVKFKSAEYYIPKAKGYMSLKEIVELTVKEK